MGHVYKRLMIYQKPFYWCPECKHWIHIKEYKERQKYYKKEQLKELHKKLFINPETNENHIGTHNGTTQGLL